MATPLDPVLLHAETGDLEALKVEVEKASPETLKKRLKCRDPDRRTALHRACANGHDQVVAYLISQGAAVEVEDDEAWTPLHSSASRGAAALVATLLAAKVDVEAATSSGATAMHFAASKGHEEVLRQLLAAGAQINSQDRNKGTPLLRAAGAGRFGAMKILLEAQADVLRRDKAGENVFHIAINSQNLEMCELLFERDEAERLMIQENDDGKTGAQMLLDLQPIELRDKIKSIWKEKRGG